MNSNSNTLRKFFLILAATLLSACATTPQTPAKVTLAVAQTDRGVMIWLPDNVLFEFGKADINKVDAAPYLDRTAELLKTKTTRAVSLEGHSDNIGSDSANLALSEKRAVSVRTELLLRGVAADRLNALGFGKTKPLAPNDTELGRKLNRRVELVVLGETIENLSRGEPANAFEMAFDKLRQQLDQPQPKSR